MSESFDVVDLIRTKRDHGTLSTPEIDWLVDAYTRGFVGNEQMAAMAMAIVLNGMERQEIRDLTTPLSTLHPTRRAQGSTVRCFGAHDYRQPHHWTIFTSVCGVGSVHTTIIKILNTLQDPH